MEIILIRHGQTAGNLARKYIGATDEPLSRAGILGAMHSGIFTGVPLVYASPATRAVQTARIKFPHARCVLVPGLWEMDFGAFEGKSADELSGDFRYRTWVEGECFGECPGGEGRIAFCSRSCVAFAEIVGENLARQSPYLVIVAHAGTIMAVMERFARPQRTYFEWAAPHCGGYVVSLDSTSWGSSPHLTNCREI